MNAPSVVKSSEAVTPRGKQESSPPSADVSAGDKEKEDSVELGGGRAATRTGQNELLGVVQAAYLKHHVGLDNIGWDALGDMMQNALCNAMGDAGFQRWLEENTK